MTVLLVYGAYTSNAARKILSSLSESIVILEIDDHVPVELVTSNMSVRTYESYLSEADYDAINRFVLDFMQNSFHIDGDDLTEWHGISLGSAVMVEELLMPTITTIKNAVCAQRVFEQEYPKQIYLGDGLGLPKDVWRVEAERSGIPCVILESDPPVHVDPMWMSPRASQRRQPWKGFLVRYTSGSARMIHATVKWLGKQMIEWLCGYSRRPCILLESNEDTELALRLKEASRVKVKYVSECTPPLLQYLTYRLAERKAKQAFARRWNHMRVSGPTAPNFKYQGIDLWQHLSCIFESVFKTTLPACAGMTAVAQRDLHRGKPTLLLSKPEYQKLTIIDSLLAKAQGTLVVSRQREWSMGDCVTSCPPIAADYILCWGDYNARHHEKQGFPREHILKVGNPYFGKFVEAIGKVDTPKVRQDLDLNINSKVVLFTDQYFQPFEANMSPLDFVATRLDAISMAARELSDVYFIMKFHPSTGMDEWHERKDALQRRINRLKSARLSNLRLAPLRSDILGLLAVADVVMTYSSTTGIEAMVLNKPVLILDFPGIKSYWPDLDTDEAPFSVNSVEEVVPTLHGLLTDGEVREDALARQRKYIKHILAPTRDQVDIIKLLALEYAEH